MAKYAKTTSVSVARSKVQIQELLINWGITEFYFGTSSRGEGIGFSYQDRVYKFNVPMPEIGNMTEKQHEQAKRQRWRIQYMGLKMRLEEVDAGLETFSDQFLAKMCLPDGNTVSDFIKSPELMKKLGQTEMPKLLSE